MILFSVIKVIKLFMGEINNELKLYEVKGILNILPLIWSVAGPRGRGRSRIFN